MYDAAGVKFNLASPKQLGEVLFEKLKLDPKAKKTKTGQYATGEEVLQKLDGMFAFAIYDSVEEKLFCARDRFGEKPFYFFYVR